MKKISPITFFKEGVSFRMNKQEALRKWITLAAKKEGYNIEQLNYIFCSDRYLKKMNVSYLNHNYYTDIITFDNSVEKKKIIGDVFISIDTIKYNATEYKTTFENELARVMIHGLLHLVGYSDRSPKDQKKMSSMEDFWLSNKNRNQSILKKIK